MCQCEKGGSMPSNRPSHWSTVIAPEEMFQLPTYFKSQKMCSAPLWLSFQSFLWITSVFTLAQAGENVGTLSVDSQMGPLLVTSLCVTSQEKASLKQPIFWHHDSNVMSKSPFSTHSHLQKQIMLFEYRGGEVTHVTLQNGSEPDASEAVNFCT